MRLAGVFNGELIELIDSIRRDKEQTIDHDSHGQGGARGMERRRAPENAQSMVQDFRHYLEAHRDEIEALTIYFAQPHRRREVTYGMIREVFDKLKSDQPRLAPLRVWQAYSLLDEYKGSQPASELTALVALIRRVLRYRRDAVSLYGNCAAQFPELDHDTPHGQRREVQRGADELAAHDSRPHHHLVSSGTRRSGHGSVDGKSGMGQMYELFGNRMDEVIDELNEALAA